MEFLLQPNVYTTGSSNSLLKLLDNMWIKDHVLGEGTLYIISGFANYNGGVRFLPYFTNHVHTGGNIKVIIGGSTSQRLSSLQIAEALLKCGAEVFVVNRKRLVHAKCYGYSTNSDQELVVTSGNFTGPGMSQNAEAALRIDPSNTHSIGFSWEDLIEKIFSQGWDIYQLNSSDIVAKTNPGWKLLFDEVHSTIALDENQQTTMIVTLSHSDTVRIQATPGTNASKGTQYFWLNKGTFDFFPALTEPNKRGIKNTFSTLINMNYIDLGITDSSRVTFEADNNLDFRLGTGALRNTRIADENDLALISRINEYDYELRIIKQSSKHYAHLLKYAINYIGNFGKRFGYISNNELKTILDL
ncbi:phospholipase D-like domain-containing protein [Eisenbergiella sp.]|uniref:phospholipase D-like domain-containing protein n=1 Tax=Eisenbergiella sp. TaxID=1924109 RepID=UPI00208B5052|nr:phospholipase D-like domain-containing protein [Eisenbergiella sp.]BDF48801.1 hypothetical protein CE91St56_59240 [Lachnospiraceae bacterium]GKH44881.1 hypothetical protein CE91St57_58550 [Lachnospiraceae bacterium]